VRRLGHEPLTYVGGDVDHIGVDAAVIEPGEASALQVARSLRSRNVPVLFTSIYPPDAEVLELEPAAYLVKPFPLYALERALESALAVIEHAPAIAAV
jgi:hypothetical protein